MLKELLKNLLLIVALTYNRNKIEGKDGQRECEYMDCIYNCDDIPTSGNN